MTDLLAVVAATVIAFAATSLDNLGLLIGLYADETFRPRDVLVGYMTAAIAVTAVAYGVSTGVELAPIRYLGYLGFVPIALGLYQAGNLLRSSTSRSTSSLQRVRPGVVPVFLLMLAQSGDSFAVFVAVFADTRERLEIPILLTVAACVTLISASAYWLAKHSAFAGPLQRGMRWALPVLLIAIGIFILANTPTDVVAPAEIVQGPR
jgi:cadmium resistance protein CadD (predicted permease)